VKRKTKIEEPQGREGNLKHGQTAIIKGCERRVRKTKKTVQTRPKRFSELESGLGHRVSVKGIWTLHFVSQNL